MPPKEPPNLYETIDLLRRNYSEEEILTALAKTMEESANVFQDTKDAQGYGTWERGVRTYQALARMTHRTALHIRALKDAMKL